MIPAALLLSLVVGQVIYVDASATGANDGSSWADAYSDLQGALQSGAADAEIWVAAGAYRPSTSGNRNHTFNVFVQRRLYGGFAGTESLLAERAGLFHATILTGDLSGDDGPGFTNYDDNSHIVVSVGTGSPVIDGFTIVGGNGGVNNNGAGMCSWGQPRVRIENCTFRANRSVRFGGALFLYEADGSSIRRCTFIGNEAAWDGGGAPVFTSDEPLRFVSCRFVGNVAGENGGGLYIESGLQPSGNELIDCEFSGNTAAFGGGLHASRTRLQNCSVVGNTATGIGGGIFCNYPQLRSSIFWGNSGPTGTGEGEQVLVTDDFPLQSIEACCIQGWSGPWYTTVGNVAGDPRFVDADGPDDVPGTFDDDLRLGFGSACIDTGGVPLPDVSLPTRDLGRDARLVDALACDGGGVLDIGAYERQHVDGTTSFCAQPPTSLGVPAEIGAPCVAGFTGGRLHLRVGPVPSRTGFFFFGDRTSATPFGIDTLCVGGDLHRLRGLSMSGQFLGLELDLADPAAAAIVVGSTWHFQALFRDAGALRLSDATTVTFRD